MVATYQPPIPSTNFVFKYLRLNGASSNTDDMNSTLGTTAAPATFSRWALFKAGGAMELTSGQAFRMRFQDDMSHLTHMDAMVQGTQWATTYPSDIT